MITNLFGTQASQTADTLMIDLVDLGVSPAATAESILAAIIKRAIEHHAIALIDDTGSALVDDIDDPIELDEEELPLYLRIATKRIWQRGRMEYQHTINLIDQSNATN
jgi:hypothetical protein